MKRTWIARTAESGLLAMMAVGALAAPPAQQWTPLPPIPDAEGFAGGFAGVSHGALLFAGGSNFIGKKPWDGGTKRYYDQIYLLASPQGFWRPVGRLPRPLGYGVSGSFRDEFIVAGGGDLSDLYRDVFALRWDGREIHRRSLPPLPQARAFTGGTVAGKTLYVSCGLKTGQFVAVEAMREVWALDLSDAAADWRELPPVPGLGRAYPIAGAIGEDFYLFGGVALHADSAGKPVRTFLQDAYRYRPAGGWVRLADLPHPEAAAPSPAAVTAAGKLLIFAGDDGTRIMLDGPNHPGFPERGLAFDPASNRWEGLPEIPISRATAPTAVWDGFWVMIGGERKPGYRTPETWGLRLDRQ